MINSISVTNSVGSTLKMILTQPELSGIIVKSIDGLGPTSANINFTELVTIDGAIANSARLDTRDLRIDLIFMENPLIEDTRLKVYEFFPTKKPITFTIETDRRGEIHCYGIVEKNEPKIFQKQEGCSITIKCGDPFFHSKTLVKKMFYGVEPLFEFPYENELSEEVELTRKLEDQIVNWPVPLPDQTVDDIDFAEKFYPVKDGNKWISLRVYEDSFDSYYLYGISMTQHNGNHFNNYGFSIDPNETDPRYTYLAIGEEVNILNDHSIAKVRGEENGFTLLYKTDRYRYDIMVYTFVNMHKVAYNTEFSEIHYITEGTIDYKGEADAGVIIEIHAKGPASQIRFYDRETYEKIEIDDAKVRAITGLPTTIDQGDRIIINTNPGYKSAKFVRSGKEYDILSALVAPIGWFKLYNGPNTFGYLAAEGELENLVFEVKYDLLYEGA